MIAIALADFGSTFTKLTISNAVNAASTPLFPGAGLEKGWDGSGGSDEDRTLACSTSSVVSTPKATGTPVSRATASSPTVAALDTYSK